METDMLSLDGIKNDNVSSTDILLGDHSMSNYSLNQQSQNRDEVLDHIKIEPNDECEEHLHTEGLPPNILAYDCDFQNIG